MTPWKKLVVSGIIVSAILVPLKTNFSTGYATSAASEPLVADSSWVADSDLEAAVQLIDALTFAADSLSILNTRLAALLALEQEGQSVIPASFWTHWYVWLPIFGAGIATGWYVTK